MRSTLVTILFLLFGLTFASHVNRHSPHLRIRRHGVSPLLPLVERAPPVLLAKSRRKQCSAKSSTSSTHSSSKTTSSSSSLPASSSTAPKKSTSNSIDANGRPANWPTKTQAGPTYSATAASSSDPRLLSISEALNNKENKLFTQAYTGELTYYGQGLGACGDTYDDSTYTAAISQHLYDIWPGASESQNRNPVCGPYTPGRSVINNAGTFDDVVKSSAGSVMIGGDGLPNCNPVASIKCHIPLTATITNPATGKSVIVKIVDRCVGCAQGDIDVTPTVFATIADMSLGRVPGIQWHFNNY